MRGPRCTFASALRLVSGASVWLGLSSLMALTSGCDKEETKKRDDLEAAAAAALGEGKDDKTKELDAKEEQARKQAYAEHKAEEEAEKAKLEAIAAKVVKGRDEQPKDLDAACTELIEVYSDWVKAVYFDDDGFQIEFFDNKKKNLGAVKGKCAKLGSIEATTCMVEVVKGVTAEDFPEADRKLIQGKPEFLFDKCVEKFAPDKL